MVNRLSGVISRLDCRPNTLACKPNQAFQSPVPQVAHDTVRFSGLPGRTARAALLMMLLTPFLAMAGCNGPNSKEKEALTQVDASVQPDQQAKLLATTLLEKGSWNGRTEALKRLNLLSAPDSVKMPAYLAVAEQLYETNHRMSTVHYTTAGYLRTGLLAVAAQPDMPKERSATITAFAANLPLVNPKGGAIDPVSDTYKTLKATLDKAYPRPTEQ